VKRKRKPKRTVNAPTHDIFDVIAYALVASVTAETNVRVAKRKRRK
jgi:hypothetical protein